MDENGISCDFGVVKQVIRDWIDHNLDHGVMIGAQDDMLDHFIADGTKLFIFGQDGEYEKMPWPTVEAVAAMLGEKLQARITTIDSALFIDVVRVQETQVNSAEWQPSMVRQKGTP
jgi:6-pyruvoyl-tetrahydropterin synthase